MSFLTWMTWQTQQTVSPFLREHITLQLVVTPHWTQTRLKHNICVSTSHNPCRRDDDYTEVRQKGCSAGGQTKAMQIKPTTVT